MPLLIYCYIADLIFGDPEWLPHPVRGMGKLVKFFEKRLWTGSDNKWIGRMKGMILVFIVVGVSLSLSYFLIKSSQKFNLFLRNLIWIYLGYTTLSVKDLFLKARAVLNELKEGRLPAARSKLSHIVGRDTQNLSQEKIIKATVESVAESTTDGIIGPLFYLSLGGPVLAMAYKAINTLDSMVGYKNDRYIHLGWLSAKLDDVANFIPARITGILVPISSFIAGKGFGRSFGIVLRDGKRHPSPNSGISEAAIAGALGLRLGGPSTYQGQLIHKPYLGEDKVPIRPSLINEALRISFITSFFMVLIGVLLKCVL